MLNDRTTLTLNDRCGLFPPSRSHCWHCLTRRAQRVRFPRCRPPQWGALEPGPYDVGFRLAAEYDYSRRVAPSVDFEGKANPGPLEMTMPVAVWYPAKASPSWRRMEYGEFAALSLKRTNLTPVTPADRRAANDNMRAFAGFAFGRQIPESTIRAVDTATTAAIRDATPAAGRFPVVLAETDGSMAADSVSIRVRLAPGVEA